jgi:hypothetical protein
MADKDYIDWLYSGQPKDKAEIAWTPAPKLLCCHCNESVDIKDASASTGQHYPSKFLVHAKCNRDFTRNRAQSLREFDQNCNDCSHFTGVRFEGNGPGRVRVGRCSLNNLVECVPGDYGLTYQPVKSVDGSEIRVFANTPMFMPCFELLNRGK